MHAKCITAILSTAALGALLTGCGGDSEGATADYCDVVEHFNENYASLDEAEWLDDKALLNDMKGALQDITGSAPGDIKEDWDTVASAFSTYTEEMVKLTGGSGTVAPEKQTELEEKMAKFGGLDAAGERIKTQLKEECDITFEGGRVE